MEAMGQSQANRPVGVFDSGLGGLTVLSAIQKKLPHENLIYFGDTARVPYGSKSRETVVRYSLEILDFLEKKNVKTVVVACNTASAHALEELSAKSSIPIMGVIEPGIQALLGSHPHIDKAAVIATKSTVKSNAYKSALEKSSTLHLYQKACPLLVPLIEEGFGEKSVTEMVIRDYLAEIERENIEHLILGCTHYPLIKNTILRVFPQMQLIDSSVETARALFELLKRDNILNPEEKKRGKVELYLSDITDSLADMESLFFGDTIDTVEKVLLGW